MSELKCWSFFFFFSSRRRHTRYWRDWSSDVCSSDLSFRSSLAPHIEGLPQAEQRRLIAVCLAIYSAPFWQLLRDRGELTGDEPGEAAAWALTAVLQAAKARTRGTRSQRPTTKERRDGQGRRRRKKR